MQYILQVQKVAASILKSFLDGETYDQQNCARLAQKISDMIKTRVKEEHLFPRYKLVCHVLISKNNSQCMQTASRCLWNTETDTQAVASYSSKDLIATAAVFGLYYE